MASAIISETLTETVVDVLPVKEATISPTSEFVSVGDSIKFGPMTLMNALAACVMSARLRAEYRRWSFQHVVSGLAALGRGVSAAVECMVDTAGDLPSCPTAKLEAHQNRVTSCMFHQRKGLLATRYDGNCCFIIRHGGEGNLRPRRPPREYLGEYTS